MAFAERFTQLDSIDMYSQTNLSADVHFFLDFFVFLILLQEYVCLLQEYVKPVFLIMFSQEYVKFELPPNQPITVSIGVDVKDIPKVPSKLLKTSELMRSWVSGL